MSVSSSLDYHPTFASLIVSLHLSCETHPRSVPLSIVTSKFLSYNYLYKTPILRIAFRHPLSVFCSYIIDDVIQCLLLSSSVTLCFGKCVSSMDKFEFDCFLGEIYNVLGYHLQKCSKGHLDVTVFYTTVIWSHKTLHSPTNWRFNSSLWPQI